MSNSQNEPLSAFDNEAAANSPPKNPNQLTTVSEMKKDERKT